MIYFIGAGPGATDLITVRGMRLLQKADVVIYAGSLVNPELLDYCRPETTIYNSASMTLEQTVAAMRDAPEGATVVRLHTGDPCLYGAIAEQMRELDKLGLAYEVVPGVSSFCGAAAAIPAEYTPAEVSQTLIITRMAGRTPVPEQENLRALASHRASMTLFLSVSMLKDVCAGRYARRRRLQSDVAGAGGRARYARGYRGKGGAHQKDRADSRRQFSAGERQALQALRSGVRPRLSGGRNAMNIRAIAFTEKGQGWQEKLGFTVTRGVPVMQWAREAFADADALLFIGACGIAVRAIAPLCRDKAADPAVLVMDEMGRHIIPILSGHIGGANDLALLLAERTGAEPVLTTATDVRGVPAIDSWAMKNDCAIENKAAIQAVSAAALAGKSVGVAITEREIRPPFPVTLFLRPRTLTLGVGCKRGTDAAHLEDCFRAFLHENGVSPLSVRAVATIDVKKDEAAILALCEKYRFPLQTYSAAELNAVPGVFAHSDFVMKTVGCGCVCERAAVMTGGRLLVGKTTMQGVTLALAGEENV